MICLARRQYDARRHDGPEPLSPMPSCSSIDGAGCLPITLVSLAMPFFCIWQESMGVRAVIAPLATTADCFYRLGLCCEPGKQPCSKLHACCLIAPACCRTDRRLRVARQPLTPPVRRHQAPTLADATLQSDLGVFLSERHDVAVALQPIAPSASDYGPPPRLARS